MKKETLSGPVSSDAVVVHDRPGRRRFIRSGAALLLTGSAVSGPALADCDSAGGEKTIGQPGSDTDTGTSADPAGCGRRPEKPKITRKHQISSEKVMVAKIKASERNS